MKLTFSWLKEYLDSNASLEQICQKLTDIGLEVENVEDESKIYKEFSVAQIISAKPHPDSKKLKICQVQTFLQEDPLQVICGAKNAREGIKVAFAKIGSVIPANQMVIKKAKIAGFTSNGMLCSQSELNLGGDDEGIIEIDNKWPLGTKISEVYNINEAIIDINITPNRGDCLGVYGIARDLAASGIGTLKNLSIKDNKSDKEFPYKISNSATDYCSSISFCHIYNVKNCPSPDWLKNKLEKVGINSISAIVDVTNYVMLCLNQPMHAYDASKIDDSITIRLAQNGEKFTTLKEQDIILDDKSLVIADNSKNLSLAGIIGGYNSSCDLVSNEIILEAASFNATSIARTGRAFNILSDSRYRFERGVDINSQQIAINMAANLISEICGGSVSKIAKISKQEEGKVIDFILSDFTKIIGLNIDSKIAIKILQDLGFLVEQCKDSIKITVPSWRHDINCYQDIVEEIIRIYGYNKIEIQPLPFINKFKIEDNISSIKSYLKNHGFIETISWSFIDSNLVEDFTNINQDFIIANPISQEMNYLRPNLLIGLLKSYKNNDLRGLGDLSLFEVGNIFIDEPTKQNSSISAIRVGKNKPNDHYKDARNFDVFDVKKDIFDIINIYGLKSSSLQFDNINLPKYYHPYRSTAIKLGKNIIGYFGEIHPLLLQKFSIKNSVNAFEIFIDNLPLPKNKTIKPYIISDFQSVERDFAFIVNEEIAVGNLIDDICKIDRDLIKDVIIFDIYRGNNIAKDKKSVALRVKIQSFVKTLQGEEIDSLSGKISEILQQKYQAQLRS